MKRQIMFQCCANAWQVWQT